MQATGGQKGGSEKLGDLIKQEQGKSAYPPISLPVAVGAGRFWRPAFEILATAAAVVLVAGILFPSFGAMRERSRQVACSQNLGQIGRAMAAFSGDNDGLLGNMTVKTGSPWWKIGDQGSEIQSNTRYPWRLVKGGYVDSRAFVCPGHCGGSPVHLTTAQMAALNDFPLRSNISYSFGLLCDKNNSLTKRSRRIIAADLNPVFQQISFQTSSYRKLNEFERIQLDEQLRRMMSYSHRKNGQNVLFCDGSVKFIESRVINDDDIFTIKDVDTYTGKETPCDVNDVFLVP
jgi:prepilin-type processing-associated H-X9-DG protein